MEGTHFDMTEGWEECERGSFEGLLKKESGLFSTSGDVASSDSEKSYVWFHASGFLAFGDSSRSQGIMGCRNPISQAILKHGLLKGPV